MTSVFVLRHPETAWNVAERYQGRLESTLSPMGQRQARSLVSAFAGSRLDAVYSSPLVRASGVAKDLAHATNSPYLLDARLTEIAMGPWEGLSRLQIERAFPDLYERWYAEPHSVRFPGGESLQDVRGRAISAMSSIFRTHPEAEVAVVTHSAVIQVLIATAVGLDLRYIHRIRVSNGGVSTFCGAQAPGTLLVLNSTESIYGGPVQSAATLGCKTWNARRVTA